MINSTHKIFHNKQTPTPLLIFCIILPLLLIGLASITTTTASTSPQLNALAVKITATNHLDRKPTTIISIPTDDSTPTLPHFLTNLHQTLAEEEEEKEKHLGEEHPGEEAPEGEHSPQGEEEEEEEEEPEEPKNPMVVFFVIGGIFLILFVIFIIAVATEVHVWLSGWLARRRADKAPVTDSQRFEAQLANAAGWNKLPAGARHDHIIGDIHFQSK